MVRVFGLGKIHYALRNFATQTDKLSSFDKRLIKGFYVADKLELENDSELESQHYVNRVDFGRAKDIILWNQDEKLKIQRKVSEALQRRNRMKDKMIKKHRTDVKIGNYS